MKELQDKYPGHLRNLRGRGTFIAVDGDSPAKRDAIVGKLREGGVHAGGCGEAAIRLRPALVFQPRHADIFLSKLEDALGSL